MSLSRGAPFLFFLKKTHLNVNALKQFNSYFLTQGVYNADLLEADFGGTV